jgi:hypothetical protein
MHFTLLRALQEPCSTVQWTMVRTSSPSDDGMKNLTVNGHKGEYVGEIALGKRIAVQKNRLNHSHVVCAGQLLLFGLVHKSSILQTSD